MTGLSFNHKTAKSWTDKKSCDAGASQLLSLINLRTIHELES